THGALVPFHCSRCGHGALVPPRTHGALVPLPHPAARPSPDPVLAPPPGPAAAASSPLSAELDRRAALCRALCRASGGQGAPELRLLHREVSVGTDLGTWGSDLGLGQGRTFRCA